MVEVEILLAASGAVKVEGGLAVETLCSCRALLHASRRLLKQPRKNANTTRLGCSQAAHSSDFARTQCLSPCLPLLWAASLDSQTPLLMSLCHANPASPCRLPHTCKP